jgi:uncharacterized protein YaiI (UPF0178 family)
MSAPQSDLKDMPQIYVDGDACPVKPEVELKCGWQFQIELTLGDMVLTSAHSGQWRFRYS